MVHTNIKANMDVIKKDRGNLVVWSFEFEKVSDFRVLAVRASFKSNKGFHNIPAHSCIIMKN